MLPTDWIITLPSEAEWEKAARGGVELLTEPVVQQVGEWSSPELAFKLNPWPARAYPWGINQPETELANYKGSQIGGTSAVGCYKDNVSPYGCVGMTGNVWEWTRSIWGRDLLEPDYIYPYQANDGREDLTKVESMTVMIFRGGRYSNSHNALRCACRDGDYANYWNYNPSFRLCARRAAV